MLDPWGMEIHAMSLIVLGATFCYALSTVMLRLLSRHDLRRRRPLLAVAGDQRGLAGRRRPRLGVAARPSTGCG